MPGKVTCAEGCRLHGFVLREPTALAYITFDTSRALLHSGITPPEMPLGFRLGSWEGGSAAPGTGFTGAPLRVLQTDCRARAACINLTLGVGESSSSKMETSQTMILPHVVVCWVFFLKSCYLKFLIGDLVEKTD